MLGKKVNVIWGMFKGEEGTVVAQEGMNISVKIKSKGIETPLSTEHVEVLDNAPAVTIDLIEALFGDNFIIKSKKVNALAVQSLVSYDFCSKENYNYGKDIHFFTVNNPESTYDYIDIIATAQNNGEWAIAEL